MEDYTTDPFFIEYDRLVNLFGKPFIDAHPVLVAAAVLEKELEAVRLELTQLQIAITDNK